MEKKGLKIGMPSKGGIMKNVKQFLIGGFVGGIIAILGIALFGPAFGPIIGGIVAGAVIGGPVGLVIGTALSLDGIMVLMGQVGGL